MKTVRIVGQSPKIRNAEGQYLRPAYNGETVESCQYVTIDEGGGFDDDTVRHVFNLPGSVVRRICNGDAMNYAITEVDIPSDSIGDAPLIPTPEGAKPEDVLTEVIARYEAGAITF